MSLYSIWVIIHEVILYHFPILWLIKDGDVNIASRIQVSEPLSNPYSFSSDDLLDSQEVQQLAHTKAQAQTYKRKFRSSEKVDEK